MAPLGTLPKATIHKKSPVNAIGAMGAVGVVNGGGDALPTPPVKTRIVLKKPYVTTPLAAERDREKERETIPRIRAQSAEDMIEPEMDAAPLGLSPLSQPLLPVPAMDNGEDEDYVPKKSKVRPSSQHATSNNGNNGSSNGRNGSDNGNREGKSDNPTRRLSSRRRSARPSPTPIDSSPIPPEIDSTFGTTTPPQFQPPTSTLNREPDKEFADKVVEAAVDEALRHYRYPTAWALRLLYDENSSDPSFVSMIEDIFQQRADIDTIKEFNRLVCDKKKDGKKDNKGCYYFVPPSTGSRFTPHKPKAAPYGDLIRMDLSAFHDEISPPEVPDEGHISKKVKLDLNLNESAATNATTSATTSATSATSAATTTGVTGMAVDEGSAPPAAAAAPEAAAATAASGEGHGISRHKGQGQSLTVTKTPHKSPHKSPRTRKTRSGTVSSLSSLSSVPDDVPDDYDEYMDQVDDGLGTSVARSSPSPIAAEPNNAQIPAGSTQPISGQLKKPAAKKKNGASPKHPPSQNTPRHHPPSRDSSMPAALVSNGTSSPHSQPALKFASRFGPLDDSDELAQKKLSKKRETNSITKGLSEASFIRGPFHLEEDQDNLSFELAVPPPPPAVAAEQSRSSRTPALSSRAARAAKRNHDDLDDSISPTAQSFRVADLDPPSSARNSRAATPSNTRSSKKPRAGLRVKNSPMKKKGTSAGIPRSHGDRPSPVGNGPPNNQDENDDCCYTCGGNGEIVCCDGCQYSFHFLCIDPPMDQGHMPDEWYCNECKHRYYPPFGENKGLFRSLLNDLDRKNPRAFRLPEDVRDLFEGVRTGPEGEYEEVVPPKPKPSKKGTEEAFDFFKVRHADNAVLCHHCQKGSSDNRPIVPCSVCGLNWHLDCLDPPLAVPPVPRTWRCPCHAEELLGELSERLAPAHRYRKIKNAPPIEQGYSRGMANNGWIEVDNDDSEDEAEAWRKHKGFGRIHRLSEKGIKRDFISRVHENRGLTPTVAHTPVPAPAAPSKVRTLEEEQAALNLSQLARGKGNGVDLLRQAMISEASPAVISLMASGDAQRIATGDISKADTTALKAMLAQAESIEEAIRKVLFDRNSRDPGNIVDNTSFADTEIELAPLPKEGLGGNATIFKDNKTSTPVPHKDDTHSSTIKDSKRPTNDSAMQID